MDHARKSFSQQNHQATSGVGQLTLAEHSLCPLHAAASKRPNLVHESEFYYMRADRQLCRGRARVLSPLGLLAGDELYLWGLLGLTLAQPDSGGQLYATPHYCLRKLGLIDQHSRRGGRQYRQFADAVDRLSAISYHNDAFYDPQRKEHRQVRLRFFSCTLPLDPDSSRVWRIVWDPLFIELVQPTGGHLLFDMDLYRELDPASRRLFLLVSKMFWRRATTPRFELRHLAVDVLGFSSELADRDLKKKLRRCIHRLEEADVLATDVASFETLRSGSCSLRLRRGSYFRRNRQKSVPLAVQDTALYEQLQSIGFEPRAIRWLLQSFPIVVLREWADITLAAREHKGNNFFRRNAQAWFVDNVKHAAAGNRTPPDWWQTLHRDENTSGRTRGSSKPERAIDPDAFSGSPARLREIVEQHIAAARKH